MKISQFAVNHPVIITMCLIVLCVFGIISVSSLNRDMLPDVVQPEIYIITVYPGVGAKDVEKDVTEIIENQLSSVNGLTEITSVSEESLSLVKLQFSSEINVRNLIPDIREKLNSIKDRLPENLEKEPSIMVAGSDLLPIFTIRVESDIDNLELTKFIEDELKPTISRIKGVSTVTIKGGSKRRVNIKLHIDQLESKSISVLSVYQLLKYFNVTFPAGYANYKGKEINIRTVGNFTDINQIRNMIVGYKDNSFIYLKDVADIYFEVPDDNIKIISDGKSHIVIDVAKRVDGDTMKICKEIKKVLKSIEKDYKGIISFYILKDYSVNVERAINSVLQAAYTGSLLTVLVLFFFLRDISSTLIISISLPLSVFFTLIGMKVFGMKLNLLTLTGITVSIGMIVDASIVVLENTYRNFKIIQDKKEASIVGVNEVGGAVIASTSTTICVFAPLIALTGFIGIVMKDISITIVISLLASTFVALIVIPYLCSLFLKEEKYKKHTKIGLFLSNKINDLLNYIEIGYRYIINYSLNNKLFIVFSAIVILILSVFTIDSLGLELIPPSDTGEFEINIKTPESFTLKQTEAKVELIEKRIRELVPELESITFYVGSSGFFSTRSKKNEAFGFGKLIDPKKRERSIFEIIRLLQERLSSEITDIDITVLNSGFDSLVALAAGGQGFNVEIYGNDFDKLINSARAIKEFLNNDPEVIKTEMNVSFNSKEMITELMLDYMGSLGVTPQEAAIALRIFFHGMEAGRFQTKYGDEIIWLTSDLHGAPITEDTVNQITLQSQSKKMISFANFSKMITKEGVSSIIKKNRMKSIYVTAYLKGSDSKGITERLKNQIKNINLPVGIYWHIGGTSGVMMESLKSLFLVLGIAIFLVYTVMVIQFERFVQPLIVMVSIPFCLIGVVGGLLLFGSRISIIAFLGIIALAGVVVNNAIVLIDYTNLIRKRDKLELRTAIIEAATTRLRPILMTTLTTLLGIIPMAIGKGNGAEVYGPLGQAIAGGLLTSTLITLILVPTLYYIVENKIKKEI